VRLLGLILLLTVGLTGCATEQDYFTKPGEWDHAKLARDEAHCEAVAADSPAYHRAFRHPFIYARGVLREQQRECLIKVHGWKEMSTMEIP
jgi:hypothetical protein